MSDWSTLIRKTLVAEYGFTPYPHLAGYLTPDGELLNFSYEGYQRDMDHREVTGVLIEVPELEEALHTEEERLGLGRETRGLIWVMNYGYIRLGTNFADIAASPTARQRRALRQIIEASLEHDDFAMEFSDERGHRVWSRLYKRYTPVMLVMQDIAEHFGGAVE